MADPDTGPGAAGVERPSEVVTVLIVDDHPVVRGGLRALLTGAAGIDLVGEAATGAEAIALAEAVVPQVVLTDLRLGDGVDGVGVAKAISARSGAPAVLILTTFDHDADIVRAVEAGAVGYLLKDAPAEVILGAIHRAARGETVLSDQQTDRVVEVMRTQRATLSEREVEVLTLLAEGMRNREIAKALFLSEATVKTHLVHAYSKLGVDNRAAAIATARAAGLVP